MDTSHAMPKRPAPALNEAPSAAAPAIRWLILALVVGATTINYIDRQIIALLKPLLEQQFGWTATDYSHVISAFQLAAALAYLGAGWFVDRVGVRYGYAIAVGVWSAAAAAHAAATSVFGFIVARVVLGVAESANTPAAVKTVASWFSQRERSLALGCMNAGPNLGAIAAPLVVPALALAFGWQWAFIITGASGFVWLGLWLVVRRSPPQTESLAGPRDAKAPSVSWVTLLKDRRTWAIALAKLLTDPVWWFLLFWLPDFLQRVYKLDLKTFGLPLATVYLMATVGAMLGGYAPGALLGRGVGLGLARKGTLLCCALLVVPMPFVLGIDSYWPAMLLIGLTLAAHQGFSTNIFALTADLFDREVVGTVVGIGALFGNLGGLAMLEVTGYVLDRTGSYWPMFLYCAVAYLAAVLLVHLLAPKLASPQR
jgi:ACS family hexuronate transporter-like MFS transporter